MPPTTTPRTRTSTAPRATAKHAPDAIRATLFRCERRFKTRWMVLIVLGLAFLWIGPLAASFIIWAIQMRAGGLPGEWHELFIWSAVIGIPLLFLLEWCTRGAFLDDEKFGDALAYLTYHEWIGISKDGRQLWILTDARKLLEK